MMGSSGHPDLVSGLTDEWWRLVRKGIAGAFSPANIRCVAGSLTSRRLQPTCTMPFKYNAGARKRIAKRLSSHLCL